MKLFVLSSLLCCCLANVFLHNQRGSNNRLNEANTNRNNANRLFDSQNNALGGYCAAPSMSYYEGSILPIEYTITQGCGNPKLKCNIVLQYMCGRTSDPLETRIRDGTNTNTIPDLSSGPTTLDANGDPLYGMHENRDYYGACKIRNRNAGLWWPGQQSKIDLPATNTRQNNGTRYGYECPEERDYYPYWHPSPWKDIAVLTDSTQFCQFYQSESQNVKPKNFCQMNQLPLPENNATLCVAAGGTWVSQPAWGIPAPICQRVETIEGQQGFAAVGGMVPRFDWIVPSAAQEPCITTNNCNCALRIRYNITGTDIMSDPFGTFTDHTFNGANSPITTDMMDDFGYPFPLALSTSTNLYPRVFQDRSFMFHIKPRPSGNTARIYNLNVKGKRGNQVQVFPALQYDFSPETLDINVGDYVHFQWTGCDTNPLGNAGEGTQMTDRSNIVQIQSLDSNVPATTAWLNANAALFTNVAMRIRFANLDQTNCLTYSQLSAKNGGNQGAIEEDVQNCMKLNAASRYFDGGLVQLNATGKFYFMSTRNNNFSNRSHKGTIVVN